MKDAARFSEIYRQHSLPLYRFALHMSGSPATAEEVTHDVFLVYLKRPGAFDEGRGTLSSYLFGIARNLVYRQLGQDRRFEQYEDEGEAPDISILDELSRAEDLEALEEAILCLPAKYREAIVLCDLQEMSYEEAAAVLGCVVGTVRSRLHRGRSLLIARLKTRSPTRCTV